ncbi:g9815 [Coccomyxa elongata]
MGENLLALTATGRHLMKYRENTIRSFNTAAAAGASFVEFDVQVTRDGIPVIWHDDDVLTISRHSGVPQMRRICDLTLDEFKQLSPAHCSQNSAAGLPESSDNGSSISEQALSDGVAATDRLDSHAGASTSTAAVPCPALGRVFNDEQGKRASCPMHWAVSNDDELPTLAEVFKGVSPSVGFDIEVKMATPSDMPVTPPQEVDRMVNAILEQVQAVATHSSRPIFFSALRQRQSRFPVLLLSTGGTCWHADERRMSIAAAISFALEAGLQGLVLDSGAVQEQQPAIAAARSKGLKVLTYGLQNNDPSWVRYQYTLGIQGAIVDDVAGIISAFGQASSLKAPAPEIE